MPADPASPGVRAVQARLLHRRFGHNVAASAMFAPVVFYGVLLYSPWYAALLTLPAACWLDWLLLRRRICSGWHGANEMEARELVEEALCDG